MPSRLVTAVRAELARAADPTRAPAMARYMKSEMPFFGIVTPVRRAICKRVFAEHLLSNARVWRRDVLELWRGARRREERYAAIDLARDRRARPFRTMDAMGMFEEMIVTGAWWDYVDDIASHCIGELLRDHPEAARPVLLAWSRCDDLWKRRSAILAQLGFKEDTDRDLLYACIEPSIGSREFFLCKGIGWALRQYAWVDPEEVVRYVRARRTSLSPLTRREALRNVLKSGSIEEIP